MGEHRYVENYLMVSSHVYSNYSHTANQLNLTLNNNEGYGTTRIFLFISVNKKLLADKHEFFCHRPPLFFTNY